MEEEDGGFPGTVLVMGLRYSWETEAEAPGDESGVEVGRANGIYSTWPRVGSLGAALRNCGWCLAPRKLSINTVKMVTKTDSSARKPLSSSHESL